MSPALQATPGQLLKSTKHRIELSARKIQNMFAVVPDSNLFQTVLLAAALSGLFPITTPAAGLIPVSQQNALVKSIVPYATAGCSGGTAKLAQVSKAGPTTKRTLAAFFNSTLLLLTQLAAGLST